LYYSVDVTKSKNIKLDGDNYLMPLP